MANEDFLIEARAALTRLLKDGRVTVVDERASDSFDNALVEVVSPPLRVRLVRERGHVSALLGSTEDASAWFDWSFVNAHIRKLPMDAPIEEGIQLSNFGRVLEQHLNVLKGMFSSIQYRDVAKDLSARKREYAKRTFHLDR